MEDQTGLIQALKAKLAKKQMELDDMRDQRNRLSVQLGEMGDEVVGLRNEILELVDQIEKAADVAST